MYLNNNLEPLYVSGSLCFTEDGDLDWGLMLSSSTGHSSSPSSSLIGEEVSYVN
jgi:hypothetical protein